MPKPIQAVVIDGFHKGHVVTMPYSPTLSLLKPKTVKVDYCCRGDEFFPSPDEVIDYRECFRGVDGDVVLYSVSGKSFGFLELFPAEHTSRPWTTNTTLYFGYHDEPILRSDGGSAKRVLN